MAQNKLQLTPLLSRFAKHAAREVGARHLEDDICRSQEIPPPPGTKILPAVTVGCGGESKFALPVTGDEGGDFKHPDPAVICVVDDMAYHFPRYGGDDVDA
jgi:hypothetical protein